MFPGCVFFFCFIFNLFHFGLSEMQGLHLNLPCMSAAFSRNATSLGAGHLPMIVTACWLLTTLLTVG